MFPYGLSEMDPLLVKRTEWLFELIHNGLDLLKWTGRGIASMIQPLSARTRVAQIHSFIGESPHGCKKTNVERLIIYKEASYYYLWSDWKIVNRPYPEENRNFQFTIISSILIVYRLHSYCRWSVFPVFKKLIDVFSISNTWYFVLFLSHPIEVVEESIQSTFVPSKKGRYVRPVHFCYLFPLPRCLHAILRGFFLNEFIPNHEVDLFEGTTFTLERNIKLRPIEEHNDFCTFKSAWLPASWPLKSRGEQQFLGKKNVLY